MSFKTLLSHFNDDELAKIRSGHYADYDECWRLLARVTDEKERYLAETQLFTIPTVEFCKRNRNPIFVVQFYPDSIVLVQNQKYGCFDVEKLLEDTSSVLHRYSMMNRLDNGLLHLNSYYSCGAICKHELRITITMERSYVEALYARTYANEDVICNRAIGRYWLDFDEAVKKYKLEYKPTSHKE